MPRKEFFEKHDKKIQRILEVFPGVFSWIALTMPFWLSFWAPRWVAYIVLGFTVYWVYRSAELAFNAVRGYSRLKAYEQIDWIKALRELESPPIPVNEVHHVMIIPFAKEPLGVLDKTLEKVSQQTFPTKQISIVMATEGRFPQGEKIAKELALKYEDAFANFWITVHPDIPGEVKGKSSNMAFAGRFVSKKIRELDIPVENVTITSCDSDSRLSTKYYACLTYTFLTDEDRYNHIYQGTLMFYNNIWVVPFPIRVVNSVGSILNLARQMRPEKLINVSTYTLSLKLLEEAGYWDVDVIPEDWHLFFKAFFSKRGEVSVVPIFLPIYADAAESTSYFKTMKSQYEQLKRWAWGVTDIPYIVKKWFTSPDVPFIRKTRHVLWAMEFHLLWPVNWFIITIGAMVPAMVNPRFGETVLGRSLPMVAGNILTLSALFLVVIIIVDWKAKPNRPREFSWVYVPVLVLQWLAMPITGLFFGALPGLDAHTRLMLGKYLEYKVTEKVSEDERKQKGK